jgi:hypothetical protein
MIIPKQSPYFCCKAGASFPSGYESTQDMVIIHPVIYNQMFLRTSMGIQNECCGTEPIEVYSFYQTSSRMYWVATSLWVQVAEHL